MNAPLTEQDFDCSVKWIYEHTQSAKRLLHSKRFVHAWKCEGCGRIEYSPLGFKDNHWFMGKKCLNPKIIPIYAILDSEVDACFQIPDGDDEE